MLAEKIVVRTTATLLAGGAILGLLAFATQTPALGIALAILILASPPLLFTLAVGLKISSRSKKSSDAGSTESAREIGRWVLFLGCLFLVALVVLGSDLSKSVIVAGGFILGFGCGALALLGIFGPFLPRSLIRIRSLFGRRRALNRGVGLLLDGHIAEATDRFDDYRHRSPSDPAALHWQSIVLIEQGRLEAALEVADNGLSVERTAWGLLQRGELILAMGCETLALADAEEALHLNPNGLALTYLKGAALISLRRLDEAIAVLNTESLFKRTVWSRYALGDAYRLRSEGKRAKAAYKQAARLAPTFVRLDPNGSKGLWARSLAQIEWFKHAQRHIAKTLKRLLRDSHALYARAICEMSVDDRDALAATFRHLLAVKPAELIVALTDPQFTTVLEEKRFRDLLAWALGARRETRERANGRPSAT